MRCQGLVLLSSCSVVEFWFRCLQAKALSLLWREAFKPKSLLTLWKSEYESFQNHLAVDEISLLTLTFLL